MFDITKHKFYDDDIEYVGPQIDGTLLIDVINDCVVFDKQDAIAKHFQLTADDLKGE